ncbi:hypothetical protein [Micromonospora chersina]|uniref:hypothetical protein n=1 Tax=Micromonospora chersina TaxID=47854 RepID=UPI00369B34D0
MVAVGAVEDVADLLGGHLPDGRQLVAVVELVDRGVGLGVERRAVVKFIAGAMCMCARHQPCLVFAFKRVT